MKFNDLLNANELRETLFNMVKKFDRELRHYQTYVYLYVNSGVGKLAEFINVGGDAWFDDVCYLLYVDHIDRDLSSDAEEEWRGAIDEGRWDGYYYRIANDIIKAFDER